MKNVGTRDYSSAQQYFNEISRTALLTPEQEVELATKIRAGDTNAREQMIKANLRLVVKIAHDFEGLGVPLLDLINEGNIGLMKAVDRFDPAKGAKLATYAAWWIKQSIHRALADQARTIRLPIHVVNKISKIRKTMVVMTEELGREPTMHELAKRLNVRPATIAAILDVSARPASLEIELDEGGGGDTLEDITPDPDAVSPDAHLDQKTMREFIEYSISALEPRESEVLRLRFGLDGQEPMILEDVGKMFGITRERIRQIQNTALTKIRKRIEAGTLSTVIESQTVASSN